jgi:hypothetical protein
MRSSGGECHLDWGLLEARISETVQDMIESSLSEFSDILKHVPARAHAIGYVNYKVSAWEQFVGMLINSTIGIIAKTLLQKEKRQYLVLTDSSLVQLEFADDNLVSKHEFSLAGIENGTASIDESLVKLSFTYAGAVHNIELLRYQVADLEGGLVSDQQMMLQIGAMTARIGQSVQARRLAA